MYNHHPDNYLCPFCQIAAGVDQVDPWTTTSDVVLRDESITAFIAAGWWPNNPGHVLVIPNQHYENIYDLPDEALARVQIAGRRIALALKEVYGCTGTSFRQHNEPAGNQDVWHYHLHVFPRYPSDDLYRSSRRITNPDERKPYAERLRRHFDRVDRAQGA